MKIPRIDNSISMLSIISRPKPATCEQGRDYQRDEYEDGRPMPEPHMAVVSTLWSYRSRSWADGIGLRCVGMVARSRDDGVAYNVLVYLFVYLLLVMPISKVYIWNRESFTPPIYALKTFPRGNTFSNVMAVSYVVNFFTAPPLLGRTRYKPVASVPSMEHFIPWATWLYSTRHNMLKQLQELIFRPVLPLMSSQENRSHE